MNIAFRRGCRHHYCLGSGRSVAWLARLFRVQEVVSSNLTAPTTQFRLKTSHPLLLLLCLAGATSISAQTGVRGWYELGATVIEDVELKSFYIP